MNAKEASMKLLTDNLTKSILHGEKQTNWSYMPFEIGKNFRETIENIEVDELRIYKRKLSTLEAESLFENSTSITVAGKNDKLYQFYLWNYDEQFAEQQKKLNELRLAETKLVTDIPEVMVMEELPLDQQRKTFVLTRGSYEAKGEEVTAETPLKLGKLPEGYPRNRLGLARWLLNEENPLFARVMVNRIWQNMFGAGLIKTQEDFGNQGDMPTHPELLDWLAVKFREDGWNTKAFIKQIVMSATYRQSSVATTEMLESDPENRWLARGPSYQYSAEQVRDNALAASGLLVKKIGGPSVYPYQPDGIWEALATRNAVNYPTQHGDSLYRRSMYTIWKRSSPPPMMLNFDAPDRQSCTVRRQRTATPLQALITLNDPQFIEAARVLAERTLSEKKNPAERIQHFFMSAISRSARPSEVKVLEDLLSVELDHYTKNPKEAKKIASVGEYPVNKDTDLVELAAYTVVANTVLNYDEALVKR